MSATITGAPPERRSGGTRSTRFEPTRTPHIPFPLVLQQRAQRSVRRHLLRGIARVSTLVVADVLAVLGARALLRGLRDARWLGATTAEAASVVVHRGTFPTLQVVLALLLGLAVLGNYGAGDRRRDASSLMLGTGLGVALVAWQWLWSRPTLWPVIGFVLAGLGIGVAITATRFAVNGLVRLVRRERRQASRTLIVADAASARDAMRFPALTDPAEFAIVGFIDIAPLTAPDALGGWSDLIAVIDQHRVDTIVVAGMLDKADFRLAADIADAAGCHLFSLPRASSLDVLAPTLVWRHGAPMIQLTRPGLRGQQLFLKRAADLLLSLAGLAVVAPLLVVIAVLVKLTSRGPVLFRQARVGQGGRLFTIWKFRSMVADAEDRKAALLSQSVYGDGRLFKVPRDPRITRLGALLRRTSLDELPQLWNVVRGEMSLVGPRPPLPTEVSKYEEQHYTRFEMKPGITGPWQVAGRNRITDFEQVIRLESDYIRQWSIWKDAGILLRTIPVVLRMDGAH